MATSVKWTSAKYADLRPAGTSREEDPLSTSQEQGTEVAANDDDVIALSISPPTDSTTTPSASPDLQTIEANVQESCSQSAGNRFQALCSRRIVAAIIIAMILVGTLTAIIVLAVRYSKLSRKTCPPPASPETPSSQTMSDPCDVDLCGKVLSTLKYAEERKKYFDNIEDLGYRILEEMIIHLQLIADDLDCKWCAMTERPLFSLRGPHTMSVINTETEEDITLMDHSHTPRGPFVSLDVDWTLKIVFFIAGDARLPAETASMFSFNFAKFIHLNPMKEMLKPVRSSDLAIDEFHQLVFYFDEDFSLMRTDYSASQSHLIYKNDDYIKEASLVADRWSKAVYFTVFHACDLWTCSYYGDVCTLITSTCTNGFTQLALDVDEHVLYWLTHNVRRDSEIGFYELATEEHGYVTMDLGRVGFLGGIAIRGNYTYVVVSSNILCNVKVSSMYRLPKSGGAGETFGRRNFNECFYSFHKLV